MSVSRYELGDDVRCRATFTNSDSGALVDPTAVYFSVRSPGGTTTTYQYGVDGELTQVSTGLYSVTVDANEVGIWHYRFYSTGTGKGANQGQFEVIPSVFA